VDDWTLPGRAYAMFTVGPSYVLEFYQETCHMWSFLSLKPYISRDEKIIFEFPHQI